MIVSYKTGAEFLQDNQTYLQKNPYLSTFFTLDAPLLQEAGKINYAGSEGRAVQSAAVRRRSLCTGAAAVPV